MSLMNISTTGICSKAPEGPAQPRSLLILNTPCDELLLWIKETWESFKSTGMVVCADGGANRLHDALEDTERARYVPDVIYGDLDSVRSDVKDYYLSRGCELFKEIDQDYTDFTKAVKFLICKRLQKNSLIIACNGLAGRGDQVFGCLQTLFEAANIDASATVCLLSYESMCCLLQPGLHVIRTDSGLEEGHCGLIPLGQPVKSITTTGLQWNLEGASMSFGGLVSVCNLLDRNLKQVTVETSHPVLWSIAHNLLTSPLT